MSTFPTIVGHRGARGEAPENTAAGFQVAMEAGVTEIELDVRLSRDGHLIVVHDANVTRTTGERGKAHHYTLSQLEVLDARRNTPGWHSPLGIPSLREVVDLCGPSMRFQFEVKGADRAILHRLAHQLVDFINQRQMNDRVVVTSSHTGFLRMLGTMTAHIERGYVAEYRYQQPTRRAVALGCTWLMPRHTLVTPALMRRARRRNLKVSTWTVNDLTRAERMVELGVDGIITDFPTSFIAHFQRRAARKG
ncbi:MAG: glycerophosphodiester phosphodiesterase [Alloalcanivorax venustensis]|jgi:glycerophosphoryl diester phosphodiesterase|uniref:glycerophosphodiester phosphodiesterase n=1 Tax=Alloalcanivorax venustensis TaxID=172371 RepID=UPI00079265E3|nr:MAG: glycerophosphodiester phosphodiesterase [Alcanivorax sp. Nap_24]MCH2552870.1 glycerophosphodiester phosphodiesterase [Alcanivorax sp.]MED5602480.1 glycerophosphodiester phosphodiesterase [Pseudomonadota bacterium]MEE3010181.1 glycerophosphodiester phosphodiesterase [Pseudomonadota bacterium]|tara:strand:+ start:5247 stop:5996 length:750 start_codon:yes stop_codon:yes gene_type:complete